MLIITSPEIHGPSKNVIIASGSCACASASVAGIPVIAIKISMPPQEIINVKMK
jgi:uncharacterized lipoprotein YbaY